MAGHTFKTAMYLIEPYHQCPRLRDVSKADILLDLVLWFAVLKCYEKVVFTLILLKFGCKSNEYFANYQISSIYL